MKTRVRTGTSHSLIFLLMIFGGWKNPYILHQEDYQTLPELLNAYERKCIPSRNYITGGQCEDGDCAFSIFFFSDCVFYSLSGDCNFSCFPNFSYFSSNFSICGCSEPTGIQIPKKHFFQIKLWGWA